MIIATKPEGIILDFFAGSGTTAHAVMELNAEDGGDRKWILCQLDEPVKEGSEAAQAGYASIDQIARERISRAARKVREANPLFAGHLGFKHYFVREADAKLITEIEEFDPTLPLQQDMFEGLANKLGVESILTTWLTADGFPLTEEVTLLDIAGYKAHYIDNSLLYIISEGWEPGYFDLCAAGRLLIICGCTTTPSDSTYKLSRADCLIMNDTGRSIAQANEGAA